ncbi:DUF421 domain-containing protein [Aristophania vespae]|uniref:DUF421 domain-containing protein n=1 Tax=Aristophania vespae TaxID=2697033 RepID=UPI0023518063|nr:YetF domain-containing protein [Aristophania vespae]UMM63931.1 hypothetical protein DM15PD_09110 [Aristophania vespae]
MMFYLWMLIKLITGFAFIIGYLNISGRTQLSQMNSIDLIGNFILGGMIGGVIYTASIPFMEYVYSLLIGVLVLFGLNFLYRKFSGFRNITIGRPIPIISNKKFLMDNINDKNNKIDILNVASQLNLKGIMSFNDVYFAQIEPNGQVTAFTEKTKRPAAIVCYNGDIREADLENYHKTKEDFLNDMKKQGIENVEDIFIAELQFGRFSYVCRNGKHIPSLSSGLEEV